MVDTSFSVLRDTLQKEIHTLSERLMHGSARDYYDYKKITGIIEGLNIAIREISTMENRYLED